VLSAVPSGKRNANLHAAAVSENAVLSSRHRVDGL
jgi:hypothetical protein